MPYFLSEYKRFAFSLYIYTLLVCVRSETGTVWVSVCLFVENPLKNIKKSANFFGIVLDQRREYAHR